MRTVAEAVAALLAQAELRAAPEATQLSQAAGRVLAEDIVAPCDVPPADNSAMDGYAFRHSDWQHADRAFAVSQRITAGTAPTALVAGTAARIFTGAEIPAGADTVVMQEHCVAENGQVQVRKCPLAGANIRPRGQDMQSGERVLTAGRRLDAPAVGLLASLGLPAVRTYRPLRVAVISNGSELVEPGRILGPGQIFNSNRYLLDALIGGWGFEARDFGIVPDDPAGIREVLLEAAGATDVIVSSGGVSVGEEDHIKEVVAELGAIDLWKVAIKPGKPFAFGRVGDTPLLGLPGNPASVLVTCLIIARPYLMACQGLAVTPVHPVLKAALFDHPGSPREEYLRARVRADGVECYPQQSSGVLRSAVWGDGLVVQRAGRDIRRGEAVEFLPYALLQ